MSKVVGGLCAALGVLLLVSGFGAYCMHAFEGSVLGEKTTGIGMMIWIVGIGILGLFVVTIPLGKSKKSSKKT